MTILVGGIIDQSPTLSDSSIIAKIADRYLLAKKNDIAVILIAVAWMIQANPANIESNHEKKRLSDNKR